MNMKKKIHSLIKNNHEENSPDKNLRKTKKPNKKNKYRELNLEQKAEAGRLIEPKEIQHLEEIKNNEKQLNKKRKHSETNGSQADVQEIIANKSVEDEGVSKSKKPKIDKSQPSESNQEKDSTITSSTKRRQRKAKNKNKLLVLEQKMDSDHLIEAAEQKDGDDAMPDVRATVDNGESKPKQKNRKRKRTDDNHETATKESNLSIENEEASNSKKSSTEEVRSQSKMVENKFKLSKLKKILEKKQIDEANKEAEEEKMAKVAEVVSDVVDTKQSKSQKKKKKKKKKTKKEEEEEAKRLQQAKPQTLQDKVKQTLASARFRYINESLYNMTSGEAAAMFREDGEAFRVYHQGYSSQVSRWPVNPVDRMIAYIDAKEAGLVVADFGCGEAKIAQTVKDKVVHSFDLVALSEYVTVCDISKTPLSNGSVNIAVFCLSLMGTNLLKYLCEANRVLKLKGTLLIAEVVSRFEKVGDFLRKMKKIGFNLVNRDESNTMFIWFEFEKVSNPPKKEKLPKIELLPCVYKKR